MEHAIQIPRLSSLILKHDLDAPLAGLDSVARENRPKVAVVFWSFRVMVGLGILMLTLGMWSLAARLAGKLYEWHWLKRFAVLMGPAGFIAVIAGWITTEVGRQPFTVYGLMRTAESASPLAAPAVGASLVAFIVVYFAVFGMGSWYLLKLMARAPQPHEPEPAHVAAHAAGITSASALGRGREASRG
jgi:cytochrome d ubiquinol oxidase subunit I